MDALISAFVDEIKQKAAMYAEDGETGLYSEGGRGEGAGPEPDECLVPLTTVSRHGLIFFQKNPYISIDLFP